MSTVLAGVGITALASWQQGNVGYADNASSAFVHVAYAVGESGGGTASTNPFFGAPGDEDILKRAVGVQEGSIAAGSDSPIDYLKMIIATVAKWLLSLLATISVLAIIYAGFLWVTAHGATEPIGKAKQVVGYAIAGLLLAFFSYAIVTAVTGLGRESGVKTGTEKKASSSGADATPTSDKTTTTPAKPTSGAPADPEPTRSGGAPADPSGSPAVGAPADPVD